MTLPELLSSETGMLLAGLSLGAVAGSFLNVCAHRIPLGQSVVSPRSCCPQCKSPIPWFRNLPLVSWLVQGGKAGCCTFKIPFRYWLVEAFVALVFGYLFYSYVQIPTLGLLVGGCIFAWLMIAVVVVDMEHMIIPDRFSMGGAGRSFVIHCLSLPSLNPPIERFFGTFWRRYEFPHRSADRFGFHVLDWNPCREGPEKRSFG